VSRLVGYVKDGGHADLACGKERLFIRGLNNPYLYFCGTNNAVITP
jgi:hypothetical protein